MGYISDEVRDACEKVGVTAKCIGKDEIDDILNRLKQQFDLDPYYFGVDKHVDREAVHDPEAWRWIEEYVGSDPVILFFPPSDESEGWLFATGKELISVLDDCFAFEFMVTSPAADYVLAYEDHDILIAIGPAAEWLRNRQSERGTS